MTKVPSRAELHSLLTVQAIPATTVDPYSRAMTPDQHSQLCAAVDAMLDRIEELDRYFGEPVSDAGHTVEDLVHAEWGRMLLRIQELQEEIRGLRDHAEPTR